MRQRTAPVFDFRTPSTHCVTGCVGHKATTPGGEVQKRRVRRETATGLVYISGEKSLRNFPSRKQMPFSLPQICGLRHWRIFCSGVAASRVRIRACVAGLHVHARIMHTRTWHACLRTRILILLPVRVSFLGGILFSQRIVSTDAFVFWG